MWLWGDQSRTHTTWIDSLERETSACGGLTTPCAITALISRVEADELRSLVSERDDKIRERDELEDDGKDVEDDSEALPVPNTDDSEALPVPNTDDGEAPWRCLLETPVAYSQNNVRAVQ